MEESKLFNICLVLSMIGLLFLTLYSENLELKETPIKDINYKLMDQRIKTSGIINRISETSGLYFINLKDDTSNIDVVVFKKESIAIKKGIFISIEGSVSEYENKTEIIAKRITLK